MESTLEKQIEEAFRLPGVSGVMCVDKNGFILGDKGTVPHKSSGSVSTLSSQASSLKPGSMSSPVVCLESEAGSVLIKKSDDLTTALFKSS